MGLFIDCFCSNEHISLNAWSDLLYGKSVVSTVMNLRVVA